MTASADGWPQWRGPARSGVSIDGVALPEKLPPDLKPAWRLRIGGGFSAPVVSGQTLIYLDAQNGREVAHALDTRNGKELWQADYADSVGDEWGTGPRATPIIDGDRVYAQACNGEFCCLALADGKILWRTSFEKDFGVRFLGSKAREGTASRRGNNGSGVIDDHRLILPVGDTNGASLVCFDKVTGKPLWKTGHDEAAYSSFVVATLASQKQVVAFTADALLGAELEGGKILWRQPLKTNAKRHAATPVISGDTVMVNSHTFGTICFKISRESNGFKVSELWANRDLKINLATPVLVEGRLYSQGPNKDYVCVDASTGRTLWSQPGFGAGQKDYASTIAVGSRLLVLTENGQLVLVAANPAQYAELGRVQICGSTWSYPAYANGRLFVRDGRELIAVNLVNDTKTTPSL